MLNKYKANLLLLVIILVSAIIYQAWGIIVDQQKQITILQQQNRMLKVNIRAVMAQDDIHLGLGQGKRKRKPLVMEKGDNYGQE